MAIDADTAAPALVETYQHLLPALPDGWEVRDGGAIAMVTGVWLPTLNGVWPERVTPDLAAVAALLDRVAATGLPHCLQLRPGSSPALAELATMRGMIREEDDPLMVMENPAMLGRAQHVAGLGIRQLRPEEAQLHAGVAAAGFETREELFRQLVTPDVLRLPGVRCYLGEVGGRPVTTGIGITLGAFVGIFNIATPPADRRRGYGAAVTARAVNDGLAAGATWSWLQSSPSGYRVYERLGFRTVESWHTWLFRGLNGMRVGEDLKQCPRCFGECVASAPRADGRYSHPRERYAVRSPACRSASSGSSTMGDRVPSKSLKIPAVAGSRRSGASGSPVSRAAA